MKFKFFLFLIFFLIKNLILIPCTEKDFKQIFSSCNLETNLRTISIILISNCENKKIENENSILSIYSTLPVFNISCDEYCNEGEIMKFNVLENKIECEKCPENTFSSGGDLKIINNWNKEILKKFIINCFAISNNETKKDENCTKLIISQDKSMIMTGDLIGNFIKYYIQIIYFFNSKQTGRFLLKYKQDSIFENNSYNGEFKLFLDYELIKKDNKNNNEWKIIYKDFNEGEHQIVLSYWFLKGYEEKMKLYISNFEIINYDDNSLICEKCINSISPEGSSKCYSCIENYFFNEKTNKCEKCKENEFSFPNSNHCQIKENCNIYDKELIDIGKCINGIKILKYKINDYCIFNENLQLIEEVKCDINNNIDDEYNNNEYNKNLKCVPGKIFISEFTFDFTKYLLKDFFNIIDGFISNGNEIFSNIYSNENEEILTKNFQIISPSAYLEIDIALNLEKEETFTIKTNTEIKSYSNIQKNFTETIKLSIGKNTLNLINTKDLNSNKKKLNIIIKGLKIYGSDIQNSKKTLIKCPQNFIASIDCKSCISCLNNEIPDANQMNCIKCNNGINQLINGKYLCSKCPHFTYFEDEQCKLNEILINQNEKLRFNLKPFKNYNQLLCNDQNGILCYDNSFIVTTSDIINSDNGNFNQKDLFFISLFEKKFINIYDFKYEEDQNLIKKGQIFGLFTISKPSIEINSDIFLEQNVTFSNIKIKKNLGQYIKKIYFAENSLSNSIIFEFEEGDSCLNNPNINYKSYINLKCNKYEISSPILNKVLNNKCTFIFDWNTPYACKNCLTKDLTHFERGVCKNGKREIIFNSNDYCLIFNVSNFENKELDYNEKILDENSDLYKNIFGNNRNLKIVNIIDDTNKFKFDFDYIEKKVYIQKCTFIDNLDDSLKKFLIIIPIIYFITLIGVIIYCRRYRKILYEYEKINSDVKSEIGNRIETKIEKKENNKIEVVE